MFARMLNAATLLSPVVDEQSHIARGVAVLQAGDLRLQIGHPIGLNVWQALPLALDPTIRLPLDHEAWANAAWDRFGDQFVWRVNTNPDGIVFRSRVMVMLLTLVLGALVFRWAHELHGPGAGVLALALYTLDPNVLAHGMLATTDLGVTLFMFAAVYALWRAAPPLSPPLRGTDDRRSRRWFIASGMLSGLALVSKYSALFLAPIFLALLLVSVAADWRGEHPQVRHASQSARGRASLLRNWIYWVWARVNRIRLTLVVRHSSFVILPALLVVLLVYVFRVDLYVRELGFLLANTQTHPSFLLGQRSIEGWWYYFLVTFALKTPLATLVLIGAATLVKARLAQPSQGSTAFLLIPVILYFGFSAASGFNIGYRHLLPALPFLLVYASRAAYLELPRLIKRLPFAFILQPTALILLWLVLSSFAAHPDYIAYFNEAAPSPRYEVLIDSNLDWGQGLKQLRSYLAAHGIDRVKLSYFGTAEPSAYGIDYDPLPRWPPPQSPDFVPANPAPGVYAISAGNLQGVLLDDPSTFDWFRHRRPDAVVGQSILVYHVAADPNPPQAVGLCRVPWTPVAEDQVDALFGRTGLRVVRFDCADAWWWPNGPAWYVLPPPGPYRSESSTFDFGQIEYTRRRRDNSVVYSVSRKQTPVDPLGRSPNAPARFDGGLTLISLSDVSDRKAGQVLHVTSVWRVDAPPRPPVSIFAHLLDTNGAFVMAADGLGVSAELLRPGDVIAQAHRFSIPPDLPAGQYMLEFGFYRLDTLERYPVVGQIDRRVVVGPFTISK